MHMPSKRYGRSFRPKSFLSGEAEVGGLYDNLVSREIIVTSRGTDKDKGGVI